MQCDSPYAYPQPKGVPEHKEVLEPHQVEVCLFPVTANSFSGIGTMTPVPL